jgi:RNA polymerase sigma-54 factor
MFQYQATENRHLTTAHLAQTMTLLGLTVNELRQRIESELANNPALELVDERRCPQCRRKITGNGPCPVCSQPKLNHNEEPIIFYSERQEFYPQGIGASGEDLPDDNFAPEVQELPTYVLRQIAPELPKEDRLIAAHILNNLNEDGLLDVPLIEIARYHHVPTSRIEKVLLLIQRAEPVGVGARTPQEALLVQLRVLSEIKNVPELAEPIILQGMELLSKRQYTELARLLDTTPHRIEHAARFISDNLNPYPARAHWGDIHQGTESAPQVYTNPDILLRLLDEKDPESVLVAEIIMPIRGTLRINPLFRKALQQASDDKVDAWRSDMEQANLLVKCIQQRYHTIRRLVYQLVTSQRAFIVHGDAHLIPMTRASIAEHLSVHESTISRAVSSKTVQLPSGHIIPMERFFDRSLQVRTALRQIIINERKPLSDTQLAERLREHGYDIARRTVAKYRSMEGILPARLRHQKANSKVAARAQI